MRQCRRWEYSDCKDQGDRKGRPYDTRYAVCACIVVVILAATMLAAKSLMLALALAGASSGGALQ